MKLTILGTGNAMVTKCYNTCFAIENDGHYFLDDGGGDSTFMKQLKNADIDWREITDVFVTHKHIDHIMGIIWIMRLFGQNIAEKGLDRELNIYGHEEVIHILHSMAELLLQKKHCAAIGKQIHMIKILDKKYEKKVIEKLNIEMTQNKFKGLYGKSKYKGEDVILLKPQTYMNLSGESVRQVMDFFKFNQEDILVIYDDLDMPVGKLRLRQSGSAGGHNGIKNIILHTGSQNFNRIRVGIDRSKYIKVVDYVLSRFTKDEQDAINQGIENASDAVIDYLDHGFNHAMNRFN